MLAFLLSVGFYDMLRVSLLIRTPSSDMWRACVFIFRAKLHPAPQTQSLELHNVLLAFPKPRCSSGESRGYMIVPLVVSSMRSITELVSSEFFTFLCSNPALVRTWEVQPLTHVKPRGCDRLQQLCVRDESPHLSVRGQPLHLFSVC